MTDGTSMLGKIVKVTVDRPMGSFHPKHQNLYYPVNYGYIEGIPAPDGEEQDVYILGVDRPVKEFIGRIIAVVRRLDERKAGIKYDRNKRKSGTSGGRNRRKNAEKNE